MVFRFSGSVAMIVVKCMILEAIFALVNLGKLNS